MVCFRKSLCLRLRSLHLKIDLNRAHLLCFAFCIGYPGSTPWDTHGPLEGCLGLEAWFGVPLVLAADKAADKTAVVTARDAILTI